MMSPSAGPISRTPLHDELTHAAGDQDVFPIAARDRVVAGEELASDDGDVAAGAAGPAAEVDAVPAAGDLHVADLDLPAELQHHGVVRRIGDREVADRHVAQVAQKDRVRPAHPLFALGVVDLVAVDRARADDGHVLHAVAEDQGPVPAGPLGLGASGGGVKFDTDRDRRCRPAAPRRPVAASRCSAAARCPRGTCPAGTGPCRRPPWNRRDGLVDRRGIERLAVARRTVVADVENARPGRPASTFPTMRRWSWSTRSLP